MATQPKNIYTDPELRDRLKRKIQKGSRGGPAGRWTLRKSALLAHDYEKAGGGYRRRTRTPAQKGVKRALKRVSQGRKGTSRGRGSGR